MVSDLGFLCGTAGASICARRSSPSPGFMTLCAIRDGGEIVDFEWDYVNSAAARMFLGTRDRLIGERLLDSLLGRERLSALFALYRRIADGSASGTLQHEHVGNGIDGLSGTSPHAWVTASR